MHAWEFQALNNVAEKNGWHKFISMQDYHSLLHREEEREMHPYCRDAGIGIIPWSPLARGLLARPFKPDAGKTERQKTDYYAQLLIGPTTEEDILTIRRVEELAKKHGCTMAQVSLAWSLKKGVNPIVGFTGIERVDEAVEAVKLLKDGLLDDGDVSYLEEPYIPKAVLDSAW
jgi:aryl-alcohol dehydrogenase-like predicted oxidoreductase